jgi:hypothetical protein
MNVAMTLVGFLTFKNNAAAGKPHEGANAVFQSNIFAPNSHIIIRYPNPVTESQNVARSSLVVFASFCPILSHLGHCDVVF